MIHIFQTIFYQPILNLLIFLYNSVSFQDLGVAIILLTIIIKAILYPLTSQSIKSQKALQDLQPKIAELKERFKGKKEELARATMDLYKENKVNPFSSCLPLLIQFPFLIAVYQVFRDGLNNHLNLIYPFIYKPETINSISFGFLNLAKPNIALAILAGAAQFWQAKMMMTKNKKEKEIVSVDGKKPEPDMAEMMNKQMLYMMPALTIFIGIGLPGGLTLYWFVLTLLTALQQLIMFRNKGK